MSATATWETLTSLVESLAWPLIALAALLTLRPSIKVLINNLDKIRHRDTEFRFKKTSVDLEEHTDPRPLTPLGLVRPPSSITKFYGYLNYKGGNSNFWAFGIRTGYKLKVTAYPFRELSNRSCYFSLSGRPDPGQVETPSGTTIEYLLQEQLSSYSKDNPYRTTLTIPDYAALTTPPCGGEITNIEIDSEGPVAFALEVIEQNTL